MQVENLFQADSFFQAVLDSAQFGVIVTACDGYIIYINNFGRALLDFNTDIVERKVHFAELDYAT